MHRALVATVCAAPFIVAVGAAAEDAAPARTAPLAAVIPPAHWLQVIEPVAPHVWLIRQDEPFQVDVIGNILVVEQTDGLVLFDAASSPGSGRRAVALIRSVSARPVKAVILSHWHSDHHGGLPAILEAWPKARVISSEMTAHNIATYSQGTPTAPDPAADLEGEKQSIELAAGYRAQSLGAGLAPSEVRGYLDLETLSLQEGIDARGSFLVVPKETFADRLRLDDPQTPVEARFIGSANTDGDTIAWLPRQRVLAAGDAVVAPVPYGIAAYPTSWLEVLGRLKAYRAGIVIPGHGPQLKGSGYIDKVAVAIREAQAEVVRLDKRGLGLDDIRDRADFTAQADRFAGADPWRRRWFFRYWSRPLVGCVYRELKGQPLVKPAGSKTCAGPGSLGPA